MGTIWDLRLFQSGRIKVLHKCNLSATGQMQSINLVDGCKGVRSCLRCEALEPKQHLLQKNELTHYDSTHDLVSKAAVGEEESGTQQSFTFPGLFLWENFVSEDEERELITRMDQDVWRESQSGHRKQDFGPKVNFKKRVCVGNFTGLPAMSRHLVDRMSKAPQLASFKPVEQCNLDYDPLRGSAIDPHDDSWLWGEHLVTINLLSDTVLTMSLDRGWGDMDDGEVRVAVHSPRRSLIVLYGTSPHRWKHAIHRKDIHRRRVCSTFRELSEEFLKEGEQEKLGSELLDIALSFKGVPL
ncbi:alpha-ketoglutarate-dependent dioxygenase alkB homolog 4-like [Sinocyclocheilus rhinocerous]|uniref:Alpha-ketoglutarate-dependent dioxygenase alkB homolog 4-like n=1 Tax=Sinocyclocheilus rhinocerous TaxID=307959 RepID=A0A673GQS9_9TELE|nr:PREDICTED: alpha-ketoglutarate-dependent dioxygenase alkB homolog 4-like [Sinocyclocheilus rhinocerous]